MLLNCEHVAGPCPASGAHRQIQESERNVGVTIDQSVKSQGCVVRLHCQPVTEAG